MRSQLTRTKYRLIYFLTAFFLSLLHSFSAKRAPNIILIYTDDLGYNDLGCYQSKSIKTPHIDQLARDGVKLTDFYATSASCTPSRAALMTGSYPRRVGMNNVLMPESKDKHTGAVLGLNPDELTLAEVVQRKGYATACIGKWHLGDDPKFMPNNHGFDYYFGIPYSNDMIPPRFPDLPLMRNEQVLELNPNQDFLTKRLTEESLLFIEKNQEQPFFIYLAHPMPHRPCHASAEFLKRFSEEQLARVESKNDKAARDVLYPAAVEEIDWSTGQILKKLKELGLEENTFVIFTSDNGPKTGSAKPLSGKKGSVKEGGHRVPAIMRWKGRIPAGSVLKEMVTGMDFLPTFAGLVGANLPEDRIIDGHDMLDLLEGKPDVKSGYESFYYNHGGEAIRIGDWKFIKGKKGGGLYNLRNDISESKNLAAKFPEKLQEMKQRLEEVRKEIQTNSRPAGTLD